MLQKANNFGGFPDGAADSSQEGRLAAFRETTQGRQIIADKRDSKNQQKWRIFSTTDSRYGPNPVCSKALRRRYFSWPMETVYQVLPNLEYGDAISNFALLIDKLLRASGYRTQIFAEYIHPNFRQICLPLNRASAHLNSEKAGWLYHYSTRSSATHMMKEAEGPLALLYHNVTPGHFTTGIGGGFASQAFAGRREIEEFLGFPDACAAISKYNAEDLGQYGFKDVRLIRLAIDFDRFDKRIARQKVATLRGSSRCNFLTVGRIAPHKKIEDVIKTFYYYQNYIDSRSRLFIVGDGEEYAPYTHQLIELREKLGIPNIEFTGKVRFGDLVAYYQAADVYLCASEHEGFCVPLLEAMYAGVPVIANATPAIEETMGEAGILVHQKRPDVIAETIHQIMTDDALRTRLINCQKDRALDFQVDRLANDILQFLAEARVKHENNRRGEAAPNNNGNNGAAPSAVNESPLSAEVA